MGACVNCGKAVCTDCATTVAGKLYCRSCAASGALVQQPSRTNGLAISSMVLGILAVPMFFCYGSGIIFGIVALILGLIARRQIRDGGNTEKGSGMALTGIIIGGVSGVLFALAVIMIVVLALLGPAIGNIFSNVMQGIETPVP